MLCLPGNAAVPGIDLGLCSCLLGSLFIPIPVVFNIFTSTDWNQFSCRSVAYTKACSKSSSVNERGDKRRLRKERGLGSQDFVGVLFDF